MRAPAQAGTDVLDSYLRKQGVLTRDRWDTLVRVYGVQEADLVLRLAIERDSMFPGRDDLYEAVNYFLQQTGCQVFERN